MWVLRRIPADETYGDNMSPWKGCLYIDQNDNRAWYVTSLAKPTQFTSKGEAEDCAKIIRKWPSFSKSEIQVAVYEEVFQKSLPIPVPDTVTVAARTEVQGWNWNDEELEPF